MAKSHTTQRRYCARLYLEEFEPRTVLSVFTPAQILHAYGADQLAFKNGTVKGDGTGETIAIVDAYFDATIQNDLATFSRQFNLAPLDGKNGDGKFTQLDLSNRTLSPSGDDWTLETALDVEWAHAVAPKANILLVEAKSDRLNALTAEPTDLLNAVKTAANYPGVVTVSMSWGMGEVPQETNWDSFFTTPGVTFVASSGDNGAGTSWPAVSPNVASVGGTTLQLTKSNTIAGETGWGGSGGGISAFETLPSYQASAGITPLYTQFGARLNPDVAYVADPNTGLYVLDGADGGAFIVGGTSAGAPQWAALIAVADQGRALAKLPALSSTQTLTALYKNRSNLHDITQGSTGMYTIVNVRGQVIGQIPVVARPGYDLVTGLGTPIANLLIPTLASGSTTASQTQGSSGPSNLYFGHVPSQVFGRFDLPAQSAPIMIAVSAGSTADPTPGAPNASAMLPTPPSVTLISDSMQSQRPQSSSPATDDLSDESAGDTNLCASPAISLDSGPLPEM